MEIISIKNYKSPKYPRKDEVLANLNLLKKLPERWEKQRICLCGPVIGNGYVVNIM